jgi:hypothetical protein
VPRFLNSSDVIMAEPGKITKRAARDARLAAALRENLKRRKAQARARDRASAVSRGSEAGRGGSAAEGKK